MPVQYCHSQPLLSSKFNSLYGLLFSFLFSQLEYAIPPAIIPTPTFPVMAVAATPTAAASPRHTGSTAIAVPIPKTAVAVNAISIFFMLSTFVVLPRCGAFYFSKSEKQNSSCALPKLVQLNTV